MSKYVIPGEHYSTEKLRAKYSSKDDEASKHIIALCDALDGSQKSSVYFVDTFNSQLGDICVWLQESGRCPGDCLKCNTHPPRRPEVDALMIKTVQEIKDLNKYTYAYILVFKDPARPAEIIKSESKKELDAELEQLKKCGVREVHITGFGEYGELKDEII